MNLDQQTLKILEHMVNVLESPHNRGVSPPKIIKVEASAGSGKTFLLTLAYITIALYGKLRRNPSIDFRKILAITFTKDATGEMKNRILEILRELSIAYHTQKEALSERALLSLNYLKNIFQEAEEKEILRNAKELYEEILEDYSNFSIQTIDSLLTGIAMSLASFLEAGSPSPDNIVLEEEELFKEALKRAITKADYEPHLFELLENLIKIELEQNPEVEFNPLKLIEKRLLNLFKDDLNRMSTLNIEIEKLRKKIEKVETQLMKELSQEKTPTHTAVEILGEKLKEKISTISISPGETRNSTRYLHRVFESVFKGSSQRIKTEEIQLKNPESAEPIKSTVKLILLQAIKFSLSTLELYKRVLAEMDMLKAEQRVISLEDVKRTIHWAFNPEDILFKKEESKLSETLPLFFFLAEKYSFFLIDEFQDTDAGEWNALKELIKEVLSSQELSLLMIVGDRKQAIYRWKGGRVELFDEVAKDLNQEEVTFILSSNYRSAEKILSAVHEIFKTENLYRVPFTSLKYLQKEKVYPYRLPKFEDVYSEEKVKQFPKKRIPGDIEIITYAEEDDYEEKIFEELSTIACREMTQNQVAILVRKREQGEKIASFLSKKNIPHTISISLKLSESPSVSTVLNMIKYSLEGNTFYGLTLSFMEPRGPFWKIALSEKIRILQEITHERAPDRKAKLLEEKLREKFPEEFEILEKIREKVLRARNPYEAITAIIESLPPLNDPDKSSIGHLILLKELSIRKNFISLPLRTFVKKLEEETQEELLGTKAKEEKGKVIIKTIHSAKGLEYDVVMIPFTEINIKSSGSNIQRFTVVNIHNFRKLYLDEERISKMGKNSLSKLSFQAESELFRLLGLNEGKNLLIPLTHKLSIEPSKANRNPIVVNSSDFSPLISTLKYRDHFFKELEELNLLYVALTRAKRKIYVWLPRNKEPVSNSIPWWLLMRNLYEGKNDCENNQA